MKCQSLNFKKNEKTFYPAKYYDKNIFHNFSIPEKVVLPHAHRIIVQAAQPATPRVELLKETWFCLADILCFNLFSPMTKILGFDQVGRKARKSSETWGQQPMGLLNLRASTCLVGLYRSCWTTLFQDLVLLCCFVQNILGYFWTIWGSVKILYKVSPHSALYCQATTTNDFQKSR